MMELWGVTGLMGAGKSMALAYLSGRGYATVDADRVAREAVDSTTPAGRSAVGAVVREFGASVLAADGVSIDRPKLRELMAHSHANRDRLEKILHPLILRYLKGETDSWAARGDRIGFVEGSRLVESGYAATLSGCILVEAPEDLRLARVIVRDRTDEARVRAVFGLQNVERLRSACQVTWRNEGDTEQFHAQIEKFLASRLGS